MATKSERFELRMDESQLIKVDKWAKEQPGHPSRAEAARRLIDLGLSAEPSHAVHFSDGEKMLMLMMGDIFKSLKIKHPDVDPEFLAGVIHGGHYWAPKWELSGVFHDHADTREELNYVVDVLDMWSFIEEAYEGLDENQKSILTKDISGVTFRFPGFDANNEGTHMSIASFLTEMGRFRRFKDRILNSHIQTFGRYSAMLHKFAPMRKLLVGKRLTVEQLIDLQKNIYNY